MKDKLINSVIAITGAGSGIGRSLALECGKRGANIAISDISLLALEETQSLLQKQNAQTKIHLTQVDVSKNDEVTQWAKSIAEEFGHINAIINNAGVALSVTVEDMKYHDFEWLMNINFWGVIYGTKIFLPYLKKSKWGHIINVSSLFGLISTPNTSAYNAAKFAVRGFTESLRIELMMDCKHVNVSCVHPGGIKTNIVNSARDGGEVIGYATKLSSEERKNNFNDKMARTTPEQAAKIIIDGLVNKKARIIVGGDAKLLDLLQRLLPVKYQHIVARVFS